MGVAGERKVGAARHVLEPDRIMRQHDGRAVRGSAASSGLAPLAHHVGVGQADHVDGMAADNEGAALVVEHRDAVAAERRRDLLFAVDVIVVAEDRETAVSAHPRGPAPGL